MKQHEELQYYGKEWGSKSIVIVHNIIQRKEINIPTIPLGASSYTNCGNYNIQKSTTLEILDNKKLQFLSLKKTTKTNAILHLQQTKFLTNFPPTLVWLLHLQLIELFTNFLQASKQFLWCRAFESLTKEELINRFQNVLGENSIIKHYTINLCKIFNSSM